jgi:hypothetical protein
MPGLPDAGRPPRRLAPPVAQDGTPTGRIDGRHDLPRAVTEAAVMGYRAAQSQHARALELSASQPGVDLWSDLTAIAVNDAEDQLLRAILAWGPDPDDLEMHNIKLGTSPGRASRHGDTIYLAVPFPDAGGMRLAVIAASDIVPIPG